MSYPFISCLGILGGKQFHVVVLNDKTTIKALKKKIVTASQKHDLPTLLDAEILEIEFNDEILDDKRNLAHYEITDNTIIYVSMHRLNIFFFFFFFLFFFFLFFFFLFSFFFYPFSYFFFF